MYRVFYLATETLGHKELWDADSYGGVLKIPVTSTPVRVKRFQLLPPTATFLNLTHAYESQKFYQDRHDGRIRAPIGFVFFL